MTLAIRHLLLTLITTLILYLPIHSQDALQCSIEIDEVFVQCIDAESYMVTVSLSGLNSTYDVSVFNGAVVSEERTDLITFTNDSDPNPITQQAFSITFEATTGYGITLQSQDDDPRASNNEPCVLEVIGEPIADCEFCATEFTSVSSTNTAPDEATGTITVTATDGDSNISPRFRILPDPNNLGLQNSGTFTDLPADTYIVIAEEFGSDFECTAKEVVFIEEEGTTTIELNEVTPDLLCTIAATAKVDLTQYEADLTDENGTFTYFDDEGNEIVAPTTYEVSNGEAVTVFFEADSGGEGTTDLVFMIEQATVNSETITVDLLCEGIEPGTCPPIFINWEASKIEAEKYMARVIVFNTEETFIRMLVGIPPFQVRPFLPPRIVGEEVFVSLALVSEEGEIGKYSDDLLMLVDCESTILERIEERSENIFNDLVLTPNPAQAFLHLNFYNPNAEKVNVEIRNFVGKIIHQIETDQTQMDIDISDLSNGNYILILRSNEQQMTKQFMVQE